MLSTLLVCFDYLLCYENRETNLLVEWIILFAEKQYIKNMNSFIEYGNEMKRNAWYYDDSYNVEYMHSKILF